MKRKLPVLIGLATLALIVFLSACSASGTEQKLDRFEDKVEQKLEEAKDAIATATTPEKPVAPTESPVIPTAAPGMLTAEDAKALALTHAGLSADQVSRLKASYEIDDGIPQYDVEFYYDGVEYDYEVHAETGKILSFEKDR